jgi:hypothetical protein
MVRWWQEQWALGIYADDAARTGSISWHEETAAEHWVTRRMEDVVADARATYDAEGIQEQYAEDLRAGLPEGTTRAHDSAEADEYAATVTTDPTRKYERMLRETREQRQTAP